MSVAGQADALEGEFTASRLADALDRRTRELLERRAQCPRRGWLVRRALLAADVLGLLAAFVFAERLFDAQGPGNQLTPNHETLAFVLSLPGWIVLAKLYGLYDRDEERADHSTVDDFVGVFHLVTLGAWLLLRRCVGHSGSSNPDVAQAGRASGCSRSCSSPSRALVRAGCARRSVSLRAEHGHRRRRRRRPARRAQGCSSTRSTASTSSASSTPQPRERRRELAHFALLGDADGCSPEIVAELDVERVIVAFSSEPHERARSTSSGRCATLERAGRRRSAAVRARRPERRRSTRSRGCR